MISFENVSKRYKKSDRPALDDITLEVDKGDFAFIVGASGSGKSTMIRLILKEEKVTSGDIHVLGYDLRSISSRRIPFYRRNLGVVFQDFRLLPSKTAYENISFALEVTGKSAGYIQEAVPDVLRLVGLEGKGDAMPHELSGGEQQRVAIARAVVTKPAILLADEPTGNLDPDTSAGIMSVLERINAGGTTVLMATHDTTIVNRMRRRVIQLERGHIVRDERDAGYLEDSPVVAAAQAAAIAAAQSETPERVVIQTERAEQVRTVEAMHTIEQTVPPRAVESDRQVVDEQVLDGSAPPRQAEHLPPRVHVRAQEAAGTSGAVPGQRRAQAPSQTPGQPAGSTPTHPESGRLELGAEEDIQVIAYESQPLTERLGLVGGSQPAPSHDAQGDESEERR